jgi:hypothetical protein
MADLPPRPDTGDDTGPEADRATTATPYPGTPRWVKLSGIVALVLVLVMVIVLLASGGDHGPGRHMPSGGDGDARPAAYLARRR